MKRRTLSPVFLTMSLLVSTAGAVNSVNLVVHRVDDAFFPEDQFLVGLDVHIPNVADVTSTDVVTSGASISLEDKGDAMWFGEASYDSLTSLKTALHGSWTINITGDSASTSTFTFDANAIDDGDFFATPTGLAPAHNTTGAPKVVALTWNDPTGASTPDGLLVLVDGGATFQQANSALGTLSISDTSWSPSSPLNPGLNEFSVVYGNFDTMYLVGDLSVTSGGITWADSPFDPNPDANATPLLGLGSMTNVGFDVVPEPASLTPFALGSVILLRRSRTP